MSAGLINQREVILSTAKWLIYFDDELKVYRFVIKDSQDEKAARASVIRKWAIQHGHPQLEGRKGRLPFEVVRSFFLLGGNNE
jgi:hypothetical protein